MAEITLDGNFFRGGKSAELNPFSTVSQEINYRLHPPEIN
jgi:hypothetical protein